MMSERGKQIKRPKRVCRYCGQPERSDGLYTTIAPFLGACVDCINRAMKADDNQTSKGAPKQ